MFSKTKTTVFVQWGNMETVGYIRVSTKGQKVDRQVMQLYEICDRVYEEHGVSAIAKSRPVYEQAIADLKPGGTFVVTAVDRVYRSSVDALTELDKLQARNIHFKSLTLNLDTRTPDGRLFYTIVSAMAEWERRIISERTKQGLVAARNKGRRLGRPPKLHRLQVRWAKAKLASNDNKATIKQLANRLDVDRKTLQRALSAG